MEDKKNILIHEVQLFIDGLKKNSPKKESLEWYLINNLEIYMKALEKNISLNDLEIAARILSRFCLESMDWDTSLFKKCSKITEASLEIAKK